MKKTLFNSKTAVLAIFCAAAIVGCQSSEEKLQEQRKSNFDLVLLFEKDGCKIYRFNDYGRKVYWCNCQGNIEYEYTSGGKSSTTHRVESIISK